MSKVEQYFETLDAFWNSFGVEAYEENSVPDEEDAPSLPYIAYESGIGDFDEAVGLTASIYDYSTSWVRATTLASAIADKLENGGIVLPGGIWIIKGSPFIQRQSDDNDKMIRHIVININVEYDTK